MRDTVFITTKPLQILVAASIIKQRGIESTSHLVVADSFHGARLVAERMRVADWSLRDLGVSFEGSIEAAYRFAETRKARHLFIDTDVGLRKYITLNLLKIRQKDINVHVYEEGLGSYRTDLYSGAKKAIFSYLGIGTYFGGCARTDIVHVFDDDRYHKTFPSAKMNVVRISRVISDIISDEFNSWADIMSYKKVDPNNRILCNIYLSSWNIDTDFIEKFRKMDGDKFVKPHPHIKENVTFDFARTVAQTAPAELVLFDLAKKYEQVNVFHHGTSAERYISSSNIRFERIAI